MKILYIVPNLPLIEIVGANGPDISNFKHNFIVLVATFNILQIVIHEV